MQRFSRPRLITFNDPQYQRHVEQQRLARANQRAIRLPSQRDLFGGEVETVLRQVLAQRFVLSERRIVEYEEQIGRSRHRKYRELDALVIDGHTRVQVFEIKASRRAGAIHRALRQLRETQMILGLAFRHVSASVLLVDTGIVTREEQAALADAPDAPAHLPQTIADVVAEHPDLQRVPDLAALTAFPPSIELVVIDLPTIVALADGAPLSLDWDADEHEEPPPAPTLLYSTPDDDDESPFAAALRKARGT
jgi:hypothetical protein